MIPMGKTVDKKEYLMITFSSPGRSPGRAIVLPPALASVSALESALEKCQSFYIKVFHVMGKALSDELSCPCDRSCSYFLSKPYVVTPHLYHLLEMVQMRG